MPKVRSFGSIEEMLDWMRSTEAEANAGLSPVQQEITYGVYVVNFMPIIDSGNRHAIFGRVESLEDLDPTEKTFIRDAHQRGRMYGQWFSNLNPDTINGEWGSHHRSVLWPIDQALYDAARDYAWNIDRIPFDAQVMLSEAWIGFTGHVSELALQRRGGKRERDTGDQPQGRQET